MTKGICTAAAFSSSELDRRGPQEDIYLTYTHLFIYAFLFFDTTGWMDGAE
jgi:hypothetical protein